MNAAHLPAHPAWQPFVNTTAEDIPGGAVVEPAGGYDARGRIRVRKCTLDDSLAVFFNAPMAVEAASPGDPDEDKPGGLCRPAFPLAAAAVHAADLAGYTYPSAAGTKAGDWHLRAARRGFRFVDPLVDGLANVVPNPVGVVPPPPPPPPPFVPSVWSTTVQGELTPTSQTGGGRKVSAKGTGGSRGGWWAAGADADDGTDDTLGSPFYPYVVSYLVTSLGGVGGGAYRVRLWPDGTVTDQVMGSVAVQHSSEGFDYGETVLSFAYVETPADGAIGHHLVAVGDPSTPNDHSFGAWRSGTLHEGLDADLSACKIGVHKGGILTATTTPDTAAPLATDSITFCRGGVAHKCTFAALSTLLTEIATDA